MYSLKGNVSPAMPMLSSPTSLMMAIAVDLASGKLKISAMSSSLGAVSLRSCSSVSETIFIASRTIIASWTVCTRPVYNYYLWSSFQRAGPARSLLFTFVLNVYM